MEKVQEVFRRYEKKYLLTCEQQKALMDKVGERLVLDEHGLHTICNIYLDVYKRQRLLRYAVRNGITA